MSTTAVRRRLDLPPPHPQINVAETTDTTHERVRYRFRGPHATGTMIIYPEFRAERHPIPTDVRVQFGDDGWPEHDRADLPTIYGVELVGGVILDPGEYLTRDRWTLGLHRPTGPYTSTPAPQATNRYGSAIVRAIVAAWHARPDRTELLHTAAGRVAARRLAELHRSWIKAAQDRIDELTAELLDHFRFADELHRLAREHEQRHPSDGEEGPRP